MEDSCKAREGAKGTVIKMLNGRRRARIQFLPVCAAILLAISGMSAAPQTAPKGKLQPSAPMVKGVDLFNNYCASCHGLSGKGDGPLANLLKSKPADLTVIAKKYNGVFPAAAVRKMIAGDDAVASHGSRTMPIWGPIFKDIQVDQVPAGVRLDNIVKYLESIQQK
jgi:mono/diheme cytochrome c family protein